MLVPEFLHNFPGMLAFIFLNGLLLYAVLSGASYYYFFVKKKEKYHPRYKKDKKKIRLSWKWAVISLFGNALGLHPCI